MQIEIKIDENCRIPKIVIVTNKVTEEVSGIVKKLGNEEMQVIAGTKGDTVEFLNPADIYRIYTEAGKVIAETKDSKYFLRMRLYEMEEKLDKGLFVRISNSDIINLRKVKGFDMSFTGTICVTLINGTVTYVSRRFVKKIKSVLGL